MSRFARVTGENFGFYHKFQAWTGDPSEFCAFNMIERFCLFLHYNKERGKVTVEGRNSSENTQFKKAFNELCASGTRFIPAARVKHMIGHTPLTVARKRDDIMGVQLADFLCQPTMEACLKRFRNRGTAKPFHKRLMHAAWLKFYRSKFNRLNGAGPVWRP